MLLYETSFAIDIKFSETGINNKYTIGNKKGINKEIIWPITKGIDKRRKRPSLRFGITIPNLEIELFPDTTIR